MGKMSEVVGPEGLNSYSLIFQPGFLCTCEESSYDLLALCTRWFLKGKALLELGTANHLNAFNLYLNVVPWLKNGPRSCAP